MRPPAYEGVTMRVFGSVLMLSLCTLGCTPKNAVDGSTTPSAPTPKAIQEPSPAPPSISASPEAPAAESSEPPVVQLQGKVTMADIEKAMRVTGRVTADSFASLEELHDKLSLRGSLTLRDATLTLPPDDDRIGYIAVDTLRIAASDVRLNGSDLWIFCNTLEFDRSRVQSFDDPVARAGRNGRHGLNGQHGSPGLSAGNLHVYVLGSAASSGPVPVSLDGQSGGNGGHGGKGSAGAAGANGHDCSDGALHCKRGCSSGSPGARGGNGGDGGSGGHGGSGGSAELYFADAGAVSNDLVTFVSSPGKGGTPGLGGAGGVGGRGGAKGKSNCHYCKIGGLPCSAGKNGAAGNDGAKGAAGNTGHSKALLRGVVDLDVVKEAVTMTTSAS